MATPGEPQVHPLPLVANRASPDRVFVAASMATALVLATASIGKMLDLESTAAWIARALALPWNKAVVFAAGIAAVEILIAVVLTFGPRALRKDAAAVALVIAAVSWIYLLARPGGEASCACFGLFTVLNAPAVRAASLVVCTIGALVLLLRSRPRAVRHMALTLLVAGLGIASSVASAEPRTPQSHLAEMLKQIAAAAQDAHLEMRTAKWLPKEKEPLVLESYSVEITYPCERWERRVALRPHRPDAAWVAATNSLEAGDREAVWKWMSSRPLDAVIVYDGSRTLVAGRSREGWWNERLLTSYDYNLRPAALYGWLDGPAGEPIHSLIARLPYGFVAETEAGSTWLIPYTAAGALNPDASTEALKKAVPLMNMRFEFRKSGQLAAIKYTVCDSVKSAQSFVADLRSGGDVIGTPRDYERHSFSLTVRASQEWRGVALPTELRALRLNEAPEEHQLAWSAPTLECGGSSFLVSERLSETQGAPVYFRTDDLTGRTWKAEGSQPPKPWKVEDERGVAPQSEQHDVRQWLYAAAAVALALALGLAALRWKRRHN